jgi:cytochrome c biogenesis protein CcmG/thiol:disulfide interchange protein DsbE
LRKNYWIWVVVLLLVGIAVYQNVQKYDAIEVPKQQSTQIGGSAPHFALQSLDEQQYSFSGERDKLLFVHFWTSWCDSCEEETPDLIKLYEHFHEKIDFFAINLTAMDNINQVKNFVHEHQIPFPILLDHSKKVTDSYRVTAVPTSYLINRSGVILDKFHSISFEQTNQAFHSHLDAETSMP